MNIAIASDHAGFNLKKQLIEEFLSKVEFQDFGTHDKKSMDYPDVVHPLVATILSQKNKYGILICGSGNGMTITANKYSNIRAALCWNEETAKLARLHNDANVLCIPARFIVADVAKKMLEIFLVTSFEAGRHLRRVQKIKAFKM